MLRKADTSTVLAVFAAVWITGFLWFFFRSSIADPNLARTELWSMMADEALGLSDAPSDPPGTVPQSGIRYLSQRLSLFSWAAVILVLAAVHGDAICVLTLRRCRLFWTEQVVMRLGIGLGILSTVTLCCGLAGHLTRLAIIAPALASLALSCSIRWKSKNEAPAPLTLVPKAQRSSRMIRILALLVIVPFGVYLLLGAVSPPTDFDVREYHLQGPKEWFQQGQINFLPHNVYTSFPFLTEMLSLTGMIFAADWCNPQQRSRAPSEREGLARELHGEIEVSFRGDADRALCINRALCESVEQRIFCDVEQYGSCARIGGEGIRKSRAFTGKLRECLRAFLRRFTQRIDACERERESGSLHGVKRRALGDRIE